MQSRSSGAQVRILGVRGSLPASGPDTLRYGGDTSALLIQSPEADLILDAGSGLRALAPDALLKQRDATLVLTHFHWDHICGLPHFAPLYHGERTLRIAAQAREGLHPLEALRLAHQRPIFPIDPIGIARVDTVERALAAEDELSAGDLRIRVIEVPHPGGAQAIRVDRGKHSLVWAPDVELALLEGQAFHHFCEGVGTLFLDSHFSCDEYPSHRGWGHSTHRQAARFAAAVDAGSLLLTHHAPARSDDAIERMVEQAREIHPRTAAARQGERLRF